MRYHYGGLGPGSEVRLGDLCVGRSSTMLHLYTRYRPRTRRYAKTFVPSVNALNNEFGCDANIRFMRKHDLPDTLRDPNGNIYVTPAQLVGNLFFLDKDNGRYYWAECSDRMDMRLSRKHFVAWNWSITPQTYVEPRQRVMTSIELVNKKELKVFAEWFKALESAEEAINILEPGREQLRFTRHMLLMQDFCNIIKEAYHAGSNPASVLADVSDRDYTLPPITHCNVGTVSRYHTWLEQV